MKKIIFTLAAVGMLSACSLDETPYGFYSSDNFYKTEEDAESGLMYAYNALNYLEYLRGIWYLGDIPTETMYPKSDEPGDIHMLQQWTVNSETELTMYYFKYCYIGINRANTVIERVSGGNLNETVKNRVAAAFDLFGEADIQRTDLLDQRRLAVLLHDLTADADAMPALDGYEALG